MAWRMVKLPNGLYGRFSDIVDTFTDMNMTRDEAIMLCRTRSGMGELDAIKKVEGADNDDVWGHIEKGDGLNRWRDSIETIQSIHGKQTRENVEMEIIGYTRL